MTEVLIRLPELKEGKNEFKFIVAPAELEISGLKLLGDVRIELIVNKKRERLLLEGGVEFEGELTCAWCGESFKRPFREEFELEYLSGQVRSLVKPLELTKAELDQEYYDGETVNILPVARDAVLLAVPIAPLCREGCKGLCPVCGTNLNYQQCFCVMAEALPEK